MRISAYRDFSAQAFELGRRIMAVGDPGVGKTQAANDAAQMKKMDFIGICSALEDPSSIRGYPSRGPDGRATHCLFDGIARAMDAQKPTVLFFDDLGMASESTMRAIVRLIQFGEIDNRRLPDHVVIGAATNDVGQGCGVYGMIEPLKTRFHSIVKVETHVDDVVIYGMANDWPTEILAYLRNNDKALNDWKPTKNMMVDGACPRGWEYASRWIKDGVLDPEVLAGCVGKGHATAFLAYREMINELPDVDQCIMSPTSAPVPENPSARYMMSMALASKMTHANFGQCVQYLKRLPQMFLALGVKDAFEVENERRKRGMLPDKYRPISSARDFTAFSASDDGKAIRGLNS